MVGKLLSNTYRVRQLIGRGGMGEVYEAVHERTGAQFAIKILLADFSGKEELLARFQREAEITSRLRHPNIVKVFDFDKLPDGRPFLAMEFLQGQPLDAVLVRGQPMPIARVAGIVDQVGLALAAAHEAGVVHRDLKPGNLFVEQLAGSDRELLRVLDFGISKVRDSGRLTQTSTIMGTPYYMSPEQATGRSREIDARSDQFAFATIVYELVTGRMAFAADEPDADEMVAVMYRVVHVEPPVFASLGIDLPPEIEGVVRKGMAKKAADRFESVAAFATAFARAARKLVDEARDSMSAEASRPRSQTAVLAAAGPVVGMSAPKTTPLPAVADAGRRTMPMPTTLRSSAGEKVVPHGEDEDPVSPRRNWLFLASSAMGVAVVGVVLIALMAGGRGRNKAARLSATAPGPSPAAAEPAAPAPPAPAITPPAPTVQPTTPTPAADPTPALKEPVVEVGAPVSAPQARAWQPAEAKVITKKPKKLRPSRPSKPNEDIF